MASNGHSFVDLTDDSDPNGMASNDSITNHQLNDDSNRPGSSYRPSTANPAKRSRIDTPQLNPLALLNPRAYVGKGASPSTADIQSFPSKAKQELDRSAISFNKRMESLHSLQDRKTKAPTAKDPKRDSNGEFTDRHSGQSLLSKNVVNGAGSTPVIDLTGNPSTRLS
jgi:hypothetical protein